VTIKSNRTWGELQGRAEHSEMLRQAEEALRSRDPLRLLAEPTPEEAELLEAAEKAVELARKAYEAAIAVSASKEPHAIGPSGIGYLVPTTPEMAEASARCDAAQLHLTTVRGQVAAAGRQRREEAERADAD
jgi:hypothetical protein